MVWLITMIPWSAFFTAIGIYAWNRKKPMWFYTGTEVKETEISDVRAYNHANGVMWIVFSLIFWASTFLGLWKELAGGILLLVACIPGVVGLVLAYRHIYKKYSRTD